jgi:hypothetical protein
MLLVLVYKNHYSFVALRGQQMKKLALVLVLMVANVAAAAVKSGDGVLPTSVTINSYSCETYNVVLVGNQFTNGMGDNPNDTVLFVTHGNQLYTLNQVDPAVSNISNVDFLWQCSAPSATNGCRLAARMIVNGSLTPNSLSLQEPNGQPINCQETKQANVPTAINITDK